MKFRYLGTAAAEGWPALFCNCKNCKKARELGGRDIRTRSQAIVENDLLIDFPADTYMHVLQNGIDLSAVKILLLTHSHSDHFYPLDLEMRGDPYSHDMTEEKMNIVASKDVIGEFYRVANGNIPEEILRNFEFIQIKNFETISLCDYEITALPTDHMSCEEAHIYLIKKNSRTILYAHDTGYLLEETWAYLEEHPMHIDFLSLDCTFCVRDWDTGHMGLSADIRVRDKLRELGMIDDTTTTYINHFSHNGNATHEQLSAAASKHGINAAYDGLEINF